MHCTSDQTAGGVLVDPGNVDNGAGLVSIPTHTEEEQDRRVQGAHVGTQGWFYYREGVGLLSNR